MTLGTGGMAGKRQTDPSPHLDSDKGSRQTTNTPEMIFRPDMCYKKTAQGHVALRSRVCGWGAQLGWSGATSKMRPV